MSVSAQLVVVLEALVEHRVSLVFGHTFECPWLDVSQTDVFHLPSPRKCGIGFERARLKPRRECRKTSAALAAGVDSAPMPFSWFHMVLRKTGAPRPVPDRRRRPYAPIPALRSCQWLRPPKNRRCAPWSPGTGRR